VTATRKDGPAMRKLMASLNKLITDAQKRMTPEELSATCRAVHKIAERVRKRHAKKMRAKL
jgi:hypothetical protein